MKANVPFAALGDARALVHDDSVYAIGRGEACRGSTGAARSGSFSCVRVGRIVFSVGYMREVFSGGPLVQVIGHSSELVEMIISGAPRARAVTIDTISSSLRAWDVPLPSQRLARPPNVLTRCRRGMSCYLRARANRRGCMSIRRPDVSGRRLRTSRSGWWCRSR